MKYTVIQFQEVADAWLPPGAKQPYFRLIDVFEVDVENIRQALEYAEENRPIKNYMFSYEEILRGDSTETLPKFIEMLKPIYHHTAINKFVKDYIKKTGISTRDPKVLGNII